MNKLLNLSKYTFIIPFSLLLAMLTGCNSTSNIQEYEDKINELENKIYDLELEVEWLKDDLDSCQTQKEEYKEYYDNNCDVDDFIYEFD